MECYEVWRDWMEEHLGPLNWRGEGAVISSPFREDKHPSFSLNWKKGVFFDFATRETGGILTLAQRLGIAPPDIRGSRDYKGDAVRPQGGSFPKPRSVPKVSEKKKKTSSLAPKKKSGEYLYLDAEEHPLLRITRYDVLSTPPRKEFKQETFLEGRWVLGGYARKTGELNPLFGLEKISKSPEKNILLVEGEKCVLKALEIFGEKALVTCWPGGCNSHVNADFSVLRGRNVVLWPDNDDLGKKAMEEITGKLLELGCRLKMVDPPAFLPEKGDICDCSAEDAIGAIQKARLI